MYILEGRLTNKIICNFMRPLTVTGQRIFFYTYLRSTTFRYVCSPWTKQLRPSLYLPVAATTSGG